jgi:hypothetical protein
VTPEVEVEITLLAADGLPIPDGSRSWLIARKTENQGGTWVELSDTRIAAGKQVMFLLDADTDSGRATRARATLTVRPDAVYQQVFAEFLMGAVSDSSRVLLAKALEKTADSPYVIFDDTVRIER